MGQVIKFLIGISIFIILASSGFPLAAQVYMWCGVVGVLFVSLVSYMNIQYSMNRLKNNEHITPELKKIIPQLLVIDYDVRSASSFCSNIITAMIVFYLIPATVFLPIAVIVAMIVNVVAMQKTKEFVKHVKDDPSYQQ